jgi:DNA-binding XRE family transcriptional regulator
MDKVLILETLRNYKQFASRNQFAKYLGVSAQTLNNWYNRGTYDLERLIVTFPDVNPLWIIRAVAVQLLSFTECLKRNE